MPAERLSMRKVREVLPATVTPATAAAHPSSLPAPRGRNPAPATDPDTNERNADNCRAAPTPTGTTPTPTTAAPAAAPPATAPTTTTTPSSTAPTAASPANRFDAAGHGAFERERT
jgi:hypothetical protein